MPENAVPRLFKNQFRIKSSRLPCWDYSKEAWYFVTICTKDRVCWFGNIKDGEMILSKIGKIAKECLQQIPKHFSNTGLDSYVVMPNHIHAIISIYEAEDAFLCRDVAMLRLYERTKNYQMSKISPKSGSLSAIIRSYKSIVAREAKKTNPFFSWQSRFYEHIIRNEKSLYEIRYYIKYNPAKWGNDSENPSQARIRKKKGGK